MWSFWRLQATTKPPVSKENLSRQQVISELWHRGNLSWKLKSNQREMYELFYKAPYKVLTWLLSRRSGKSYTLSLIAIEACIRTPNSIVKFLNPTKTQVNKNLRPIMKKILNDCPEELKPEFRASEFIYYFPNGSEIQLAGSENGHAESLRGGESILCIVDEAQDVTDLDYIVKSILIPTGATTGGKLILSGTPPPNPDHDFIKFIEQAALRNTLTKKTIDDNPMLDDATKKELIEEGGGINSEYVRREYFCVDENTLIKTLDGYKKIKEIEPDEMVFTHKGNYKKVLRKYENLLGNRKVFKVKTSNNLGLILTEGHMLYVTKISKKTKKIKSTEFVKVEDISSSPGERIYIDNPIDFQQSGYDDYRYAYLAGWYVAEGHTGKNTTVLTLNHRDDIETINEIAKEKFGKEFQKYGATESCANWTLNSKEVSESFKIFGKGAKNKKVPNFIKYGSTKVRSEFLRGLFSGDGYIRSENKTIGLASISLSLLADVSDMLLNLGITCSIKKVHNEGFSTILGRKVYINESYSLLLCGNNYEKYRETILKHIGPFEKTNQTNLIKNGRFLSRILDIQEIEYEKNIVYDIEVEDDHSYVGLHSTFHNCELIRDPSKCVIPEFTEEVRADIIKEWPKPPFYSSYVGMDLGGQDLTVVLFGYFDFRADKIVIEDEIVMDFAEKGNHIEKLSLEIEKKEKELWTNPMSQEKVAPRKRVSDINIIVTQEIAKYSQNRIIFCNTAKDNKEAAISTVRLFIGNRKIIINPKCKVLVRHIENAKWANNDRKLFGRSPDNGHYDALDALVYFVRNIDFRHNPYPAHYDLNLRSADVHYQKNPNAPIQINPIEKYTNYHTVFSKMFNIRKR